MKKSVPTWAIAPLFALCSEVYGAPILSQQTFNIDENSASNTYVGQVVASGGGITKTAKIDVGTQDIDNWSTRSQSYQSINFNSAFDAPPIVFNQIQSYGQYNVQYTVDTYSYKGSKSLKGYDILFHTRQQNTSASSYEAILETDLHMGGSSVVTSIDSVGDSETVGWLAFDGQAAGVWSGLPFEVTNTGEVVTDATTTVNFSGPFYQAPQLMTSLATSNGTDRTAVGVSKLSSSVAKVFMDELSDNEHDNAEDVSLLMLQGSGLLTDTGGNVFAETGTLTMQDGDRSEAETVSLANNYVNPVVFVQPIGDDITDAVFRFTDISNSSFSGYLHDDSESTSSARHGAFSLQYFVFEAGSWQINVENYSYALTAGNESGAFQIDSNTGEISVLDNTQLDYESGVTQYQLTVTATDGTGAMGQATVTVDINNVADSLNTDAQPLYGLAANDWNGWATAAAGDVNGDGYDDIILGTPKDDTNGSDAGRAYVLFGNASGTMADFASVAAGNGGFVINGEAAGDKAGFAVAGGGDINGDGLDDVVIGAPYADSNGDESGSVYVVFGKADTAVVALSDIASDSNNGGFVIKGGYAHDRVGGTLIVGDVNGDSLADIVASEVSRTSISPGVSVSTESYTDPNMTYTVFGKSNGVAVELVEIAKDTDEGGFVINYGGRKTNVLWKFGAQSLPVGDFNSDGLMDFTVSQGYLGNKDGMNRLVYGRVASTAVNYKTIATEGNGIAINPESGNYGLNMSIPGAWLNALPSYTTSLIGDINGDGIDDMALLAPDDGCCSDWPSPRAYIVFGTTAKVDINLSDIAAGNGGFIIHNDVSNVTFSDTSTVFGSIAGAGDTNGDGYDDVIIGDQYAESGNGRVFVIYGKSGNDAVYLSDVVTGNGGFSTAGNGGDSLGHWSAGAGDINGDGLGDMLFGAPNADSGGLSNSGTTYVMLGKGQAITYWGSAGDDVVGDDANAIDNITTGLGNDLITSTGGADVLYAGPGDDTIVISHNDFLRIDGGKGNDTVKIDGSNISLNLAAAAARVRSIEVFDISGTGANVLTFNKSISGNGRVIIKGDADDMVYSTNQQWIDTATTVTVDGVEYQVYSVGSSEMWLQSGLSISINASPSIDAAVFTVSEYSAGGTLIGTIAADANDVGDSVTFNILSGNESGYFSLDAVTGALSVADSVSRMDYELGANYSLLVEVTDTFGATAQATTTVNIDDIATITHTVPMDASGGGSIWGGWDSLASLLGESITTGITLSYDLPDADIDTEIMDLSVHGTVGLTAALTAEGGIVDATLPVTFSMNYPDEVQAGQTVAVNTSISLDQGAGFTASSPYFELLAKGFLRDYEFAIGTDLPSMISSSLGGYNGEISGSEDSYTFTIEASSQSASGALSPTNAMRFEANISLPGWVNKQEVFPKKWANWAVALGNEKEGCVNDFFAPAGEDLYYNMSYVLMEANVTVNADLYQSFAVELTPVAVLTLEDGTEFSFDPRDSLTFTPQNSHDSNGDGIIDATMRVELNPVFTNDTTLYTAVQMPFEVGSVSYNIQEALCSGYNIYFFGNDGAYKSRDSMGPLVENTFNLDLEIDGDKDLVQNVVSYALSSIHYTEQLSFDLCNGSGDSCAPATTTEPVNTPPAAANVIIDGIARQGNVLSASYSYSDDENNIENGSTYQWYIAANSDGSDAVAIAGETTTNYTVVTGDSGKYLQFCVIPSDGTDSGDQACSGWSQVAVMDHLLSAGFGKALDLNGTNQYARIPLSGALNPSNGSFTVETWFKLDSLTSGNHHLVQQLSKNGTGRTILGTYSSGVLFTYLGRATLKSSTAVATGSWHHAAVVFDDSTSTLSFYLDGELSNQTSRTMESSEGDLVLGINRDLNGNYLDGQLDQTRIWQVALTAEQLKQRMGLSVAQGEAGLLAQYTFDNDDSYTILDSNASYDGTLYNTPSFRYSTERTLSLDGNGDYVEIANDSTLEFGAGSFSVEAWVYADSNADGDYRNIVSKKLGIGSAAGWVLRLSNIDGTLQPTIFVADGSHTVVVTGEVAFTKSSWHHIAASFDRDSGLTTLYVDGDVVATGSTSNITTVNSGAVVRLGTWSVNSRNAAYWVGDIDEVRIWSDSRSQAEVQANMHQRLSGSEANLVAYYSFEDGGATDMSGNGHDGTLHGHTVADSRGLTVLTNGSADIVGDLPLGNGSTFVLDGQPANGTVVLDSISGRFTYTPNAGSTASSDSFSYSVKDDNGKMSYSETITLTLQN